MEKCFLLILAIAVIGCVNAKWLNRLDKPLHFSCPHGQSIYQIRSKHHNHEEDRYWDLRCRKNNANGNCYWTGFLNRYDAIISFNCQSNEVISGMYSIHSNHHEDRMFKVKCCKVTGRTLKNCYQTPFVNNYDGYFNYVLSTGQYLHGLASEHNNHYE
ncbi:hypothetical protein KUTeg_013137 [Tegillarca granosa]|uniref:Dermatopontin n=1 Tax=Tegillarca granosa TaxID=220873 RepID=A0ABQ9EYA8_TEGGR|nr:hypothetical protein KUTeg_013137 [Tegillarca granosa]